MVTDIKPDGFLFENVESLMHPTNKVIIDRFIEIITEAGYDYRIVRAINSDGPGHLGIYQNPHQSISRLLMVSILLRKSNL